MSSSNPDNDRGASEQPSVDAQPRARRCPNGMCHQTDVTEFSTCRFCGSPYDAQNRKTATAGTSFNFGEFLRKPLGLSILLSLGIILSFGRDFMTGTVSNLMEHKAANTVVEQTDVLKSDPQNYRAYMKRGDAYWTESFANQACDDYSAAIKINPGLKEAYEKRALMYDAKGQSDLATQDRQTAAKLQH